MQKVNHIALIMDKSGSMNHLTAEVIKQFNSQVEQINSLSTRENQKTHVSLYTFSTEADRPLLFDVPLDLVTIKPLTAKSYQANGSTALFDSVGMAIQDLAQFHKEIRTSDDHSFLVIVLTDGEENASRKYKTTINNLMQSKIITDMWTFVFLVPKGYKHALVSSYGIHEGNVQEWDVNAGVAGFKQSTTATSAGLDNFFRARSAGQRSVRSFFTTDLSKVTPKDLGKLNDVTYGFEKKEVEKEIDIKSFCMYKFGEYVLGNAFYQLSKKETIQDYKKIAIEDMSTGRIYGSDDSRRLLGLPTVGDTKVTPGNHSNYRIYVQSTSVNRKLVRGSYLLYHKAAQEVAR